MAKQRGNIIGGCSTYRAIADVCGFSPTALDVVMRKGNPRLKTINRLSEGLKVSREEVIRWLEREYIARNSD